MIDTVISLIVGLFGGGAFFAFIQFLITRHDEKRGKYKQLVDAVNSINSKFVKFEGRYEKDQATEARIRILRFSDEILHDVKHSKESFDQVHSDIDLYRDYCNKNPAYKNNRAVMAISNIEKIYADCLINHSFLDC